MTRKVATTMISLGAIPPVLTDNKAYESSKHSVRASENLVTRLLSFLCRKTSCTVAAKISTSVMLRHVEVHLRHAIVG